MEPFKNRIKELRVNKSMTQLELSKVIGVNKQTISQYERGVRHPDFDTLLHLCDFFNVSTDYILGKTDVTPRFVNATTIKAIESEPPKMIPLYSAVSAGHGAVADGNIERYIVQPSDLPHGDYFGLKVKGDSMEPYILDGDVVIAKQDPTPADGSIVIAIVNGDEGFCKRLICSDDTVILMSLNSAYPPKVFSREDVERKPVRFVGTVVKLIRDII